MHTLPDKAFDLAIVDPPYGLKASGAGITGGKKCIRALNTMPMEWDIPPTDEYFKELFISIKESDSLRWQLFQSTALQMFCRVGQATALEELFCV